MSKARDIVETLRTVLVDGDVTNANFTGADLEIAKGGTGASSAGAARTALGLVVGTDVLAPDGSAANLTNLPASGAADFVASGTLPNGKPVILKANGQVEVVAETATSIAESIPAGSAVVFNAGTTIYTSTAFDPNTQGQFVVSYKDGTNSNYGTAVVGQVSGNSISFGSEYVFSSYVTDYTAISFDPNTANKFVVAYQGQSSVGKSNVGTVSGNSISFGATATFLNNNSQFIAIAFDPNTANKFVVSCHDFSDSNYGKVVVGTISNTSLSYGSVANTYPNKGSYTSIKFDPNTANKFVVAHQDYGASDHGYVQLGTVSGTSITLGTAVAFNSSVTEYISIAFDPNTTGKFVVAYRDGGNSNYGTAILGTLSGSSISFGTEVAFTGDATYIAIAFDPINTGKFVVAYREMVVAGYGDAKVGTLSGTSLSFGSANRFDSAGANNISIAFDGVTSGKFVVPYSASANSQKGTAVLGQIATTINVTNLTTTNFLGTSTAAYTNGQTAKIMLQGGISTNQSSLAIGSTYYVQPTGTLTTSAGTPSVVAGKAVSATTLLLKGI
jgi:hypothetical protein